jgi:hypothetical protein
VEHSGIYTGTGSFERPDGLVSCVTQTGLEVHATTAPRREGLPG